MDRYIVLLIIALIAPALAGCTISGQASSVLEDDIVGCSLNTDIDFMKIGDRVQACYTDSSIYFAIDNLGSNTVTGLSIELKADYDLSMFIKESVASGESKPVTIDFGSQSIDNPTTITIYPAVGKSRLLCSNIPITADIKKC